MDTSLILNCFIVIGCVIFLSYLDDKRRARRRMEEKLDEALEESFPASDPMSF